MCMQVNYYLYLGINSLSQGMLEIFLSEMAVS